ncbi:hypothetical protein JCM6882_002130 [Rhodosporidiobolus microsporus]
MSPFNCFSSPGHVETLPRGYAPDAGGSYDPSSLPQMRASPPRSPSRRKSDGRRSFDGAGRDKLALKGRIGAPTGFKHVGHVGGDGAFGEEGGLASSLAAITTALHSTSPLAAPGMRPSLSAPSSSPSSPLISSRSGGNLPLAASHAQARLSAADLARFASTGSASPLAPYAANKHTSLPPPSSPFADASNRSPASLSSPYSSQPPTPDPSKPRPVSHQPGSPALRRKAPPPVTASVIRAVPGGVGEAEKSGPVPTLARHAVAPGVQEEREAEKEKQEGGGVLAIQELFSPSEIKAIESYQRYEDSGVGALLESEEGQGEEAAKKEGEKKEEGTQTKIFKGAIADIEAALKAAS